MARRRNEDEEEDDEPKQKKKKPKKSRVSDEAVADEPEEDEVPPFETSRNNAYTGLAIITFFCLAATGVIFYYDTDELNANQIQTASVSPPGLGSTARGPVPPPQVTPPAPPAK